MEKRGVIDENTPPEGPRPPREGAMPHTKEAADAREDHPATRLQAAAAAAAGKKDGK